jgi:protocatechuate 3,4-dioxygenase beta subunit
MVVHWIARLAVVVSMAAPQTSPRPAAAIGTASVAGIVVLDGANAQPVRRATVTLSGAGALNRSAVTDDEGRFVIGGLPAGTYGLRAEKPAHLTTAYGAKGPGRAGTPIVLQAGQQLPDLQLRIARGAAITGTVRDQTGEPVRNAQVFLTRPEDARTSAQVVSGGVESILTDDTGTYRFWGLAPGTYLVGVAPRLSASSNLALLTQTEIDAELRALESRGQATAPAATPAGVDQRRFSYAPVFHPSAVAFDQAAPVTVATGEERRGVDVSLVLVPVATIEGVVTDATGQPTPNVSLQLQRPGPPLPFSVGLMPMLSQRPGPDGVFRYTNVAPGRYTLAARSTAPVIRTTTPQGTTSTRTGAPLSAGDMHWATAVVDVGGSDVNGVALQLRPGLAVTGRLVFDASVLTPPADLTQAQLSLTARKVDGVSTSRTITILTVTLPVTNAKAAADGTFELKGLMPGSYVLGAQLPGGLGPKAWWLRSALVDGRDLLDETIDLGPADLSNVVVTLSDRHTELSGVLSRADGRPAPDFVVVAFPENRALWSSPRRLMHVRPSTDGRFVFADLPPGTYLVAALTDLDEEAWRTDEFLSAVAPSGIKVTIGEGEKKRQDLRIGGFL